MSAPVWVRARRGKRITGTTLHVAVWAPDQPGTVLVPGTGRYVPLCGAQWAPDRWQPTGPGYPGWERHAHWPSCARCLREAEGVMDQAWSQWSINRAWWSERVAPPADTP